MATTDLYRYTDDYGVTHPIRLSAARALAGGFTPATGGVQSGIPAEVNGRSGGLIPRTVSLSRTVGVGELKKSKTARLPYPTKVAMGLKKVGDTVNIGGISWTIKKLNGEKYSPR